MLNFNVCPYKKIPYMGQSLWIIDILKKYFNNKHDGFLVEIGVGHVLDWRTMCNGGYSPRLIDWDNITDWDQDKIVRGLSHTIELLENGWTGIYIESIHEFIDNELDPLLRKLLPEERVEKIKMIKCGASDKERILKVIGNETLGSISGDEDKKIDNIIPYQYYNRKVLCRKTSDILSENDCPQDIDFMVIDVEGHEISVLNGIDFSLHKPKLILIEVGIISLNSIQKSLPEDYLLIENDGLNAMFVRSDFYLP